MTAVRARPADSSQLSPLQSSDHIPVLLHEAVEALAVHPGGLYVDATYGRGGHSALLLQALGPSGRLIAFDRGSVKDALLHLEAAISGNPKLGKKMMQLNPSIIQHTAVAELLNRYKKK